MVDMFIWCPGKKPTLMSGGAAVNSISRVADSMASTHIAVLDSEVAKSMSRLPARTEFVPLAANSEDQARQDKLREHTAEPIPRKRVAYVPPGTPTIPLIEDDTHVVPASPTEPGLPVLDLTQLVVEPLAPLPVITEPDSYFPWGGLVAAGAAIHLLTKKKGR